MALELGDQNMPAIFLILLLMLVIIFLVFVVNTICVSVGVSLGISVVCVADYLINIYLLFFSLLFTKSCACCLHATLLILIDIFWSDIGL